MRFYIVPNLTKDKNAVVALYAARILHSLSAVVLCSEELTPFLSLPENADLSLCMLPTEVCYQQADIILTIGGDGTILHQAVPSLEYQNPILGVNLGRCGFLATCEEEEMSEKFKKIVQGQYTLDARILLTATVRSERSDASSNHTQCLSTWQGIAMNDVVISKGQAQQAIDLRIYCDDILVESYRCDGVIIATPTGSTAYSLAAGGPIVDSKTMGIVLTAICPHKLRAPSMVFAPNRVLRVTVGETSRGEILLSCDGKEAVTLKEKESVEVALSNQHVRLVSFSNAEQFEAIDRKLKGKE